MLLSSAFHPGSTQLIGHPPANMPPNAKSSGNGEEGWLNSMLLSADNMLETSPKVIHVPAVVERSRFCGPGYLDQALMYSPEEYLKVKHGNSEDPKVERFVDRQTSQKPPKLVSFSSSHELSADSSGITFHSMDGLGTSFPLARKEAKKRLQARYIVLKKKEKERRSNKHNSSFSITSNACGASCVDTISPDPSREEHRLEVRQELMQLKQQLRQLRKNKIRSVRFSDPLVVDVRYRPYTDACDVHELYFQEEELDLLEEDRHKDPGDVVECAFIETAHAVSVAYTKRRSVDE